MPSAKSEPVEPDQPVEETTQNYEALYRRHRGWLMRFLERRFGNLVAEDMAQEAFARTLAHQSRIRNPRAFLTTVAIRAALEERRRRGDEAWPSTATVVEPTGDQALLLEQIILKLPAPLREVFLLSRFGGLSNVEIAERCNLSVKRVEARITQARAICAALMRD